MKSMFLLVALALSSTAFAEDPREAICFNAKDSAATGMTSAEYYRAIKSSCEEQLTLHRQKRLLAESSKKLIKVDKKGRGE